MWNLLKWIPLILLSFIKKMRKYLSLSILLLLWIVAVFSQPASYNTPVFSHQPGFYQQNITLTIDNPYQGLYDYTIEKEGYTPYSGQVQIIDRNIHLVIQLVPQKSAEIQPTQSLYTVTFQVNMNQTDVSETDKVYFSGNVVNWAEPGSLQDMLLSETYAQSKVYQLSLQLPAGEVAYKYFRNPGWSGGEWGGTPNRVVHISQNMVIRDLWGSLDPDPDPQHDPFAVTFDIRETQNNPLEGARITFNGKALEAGQYTVSGLLPAAKLHYTTDGSLPTAESPVFQSPLELASRQGTPNGISMIPTNDIPPGHSYNEHWQAPLGEVYKIHTIRARYIGEAMPWGATATGSFIIDEKGTDRFTMPLISISSPMGSFFDPDSGIYVKGFHNNYFQRGEEWERLIHLEFFEDNGQKAFALDMGVRIHGGTSRARPRKTLRLYAKSQYGQSWVNYPLFAEKNISRYKRFLLRNSGNDWEGALFRDAFMQSLLKNTRLDIMYARPAVVFINGEYWGIHNIRDRLDERYIETHYGLKETEITILDGNANYSDGDPDGRNHYLSLYQYINQNHLGTAQNYEHVKTLMDVENFADYQIANIFFGNTDWPGNNIQYWRRNTPTYEPLAPYGWDGRWRWMVFDTDFGFGLPFDYVSGFEEGPAHNTLAFALATQGPSWPNPEWSTLFLRKLTQNTAFRNYFINRYVDLLNTAFSETYVSQQLDIFKALYQPEMQEHINRWRRPTSIGQWENELQVMRHYALQRPSYARQHLRQQFNLQETAELSVEANPLHGSIRVNTLYLQTPQGPWKGRYFKGIPIEVEAIANPGYRFSHWEGLPEGSTAAQNLSLNGNLSLKAHFTEGWIQYWHFNTLPSGTIGQVQADNFKGTAGLISYPGTGAGYMDRAEGSNLNNFPGMDTGYGLRVRNPSHSRELIIQTPAAGFKNLRLSFAAQRTNNGARQQQLFYSTDKGASWIKVQDPYTIDTDFQTKSFDLSGIPEVNNNADLQFKIIFLGEEAQGSSGNNRFDNITLEGEPLSTSAPAISRAQSHLQQNYPNPFSDRTLIPFNLEQPAKVSISIYNLLGKEVGLLESQHLSAGEHQLEFDARHLPQGVYIYHLRSGNFSQSRRMLLMR